MKKIAIMAVLVLAFSVMFVYASAQAWETTDAPDAALADPEVGLDMAFDTNVGLDEAYDTNVGLDEAYDVNVGLDADLASAVDDLFGGISLRVYSCIF